MPAISNTSFSVRFNLLGTPELVLTDTTTGPPAGLVGIFSITQPDGYTRTGDIDNPDIAAAGGTFSIPLRLDSTGQVQKGTYTIKYTTNAPGYLSTDFIRTFQFTYSPVTISIGQQFDVFTPKLELIDETVYAVSGFDISGLTRAWSVTSTPTGAITGATAALDVVYNNEYYDAYYTGTFTATATYTSQTYAWLTVSESITTSISTYAQTPDAPDDIVSQIHELKLLWDNAVNQCQEQADALAQFQSAEILFEHIVNRVLVQQTEGIFEDLQDLVRMLNNNQIPAYTPTNLPIPPYNIGSFAPGAAWGNITGIITTQTDLVNYIAARIADQKYAANVGNGSATSFALSHGLDSLDVEVEVVEVATGETVYTDVVRTSASMVTVSFASAPTTNQYRVIIMK